jgi:uncharacterized protein YajQ (UPF0234 family)
VADSSFDVVSKVDRQEVDNALNQAAKEIAQRYDFKGTDASIAWSGESILMRANKEYRIEAALKEGLSQENAKKISKIIRDEGPKSVKAQIQGEELRVTSKSRDDLQAVQALLKGADLDVALQFTNYR